LRSSTTAVDGQLTLTHSLTHSLRRSFVVLNNATFTKLKARFVGKKVTFAREAMWTSLVGILTASVFLAGNYAQGSYTETTTDLLDTDPLDKEVWESSFIPWEHER